MQKKVDEKAKTTAADAAPEPKLAAAPKREKQYRCVGVDASTGKAVMEEVEE